MRLPLVPRERRFHDLIGRLGAGLVEGSGLLVAMLNGPGGEAASQIRAAIRDCEHAADEATHEIIQLLNSTIATPFERDDIYGLASGIDDVIDDIDEAADTVVLYRIDPVPAPARAMAALVRDATLELQQAIRKLDSLRDLSGHWVEVHRLENLGDDECRAAIGALFDGRTDPIEVIKLKDFYALLESSLDRCEDVANVIEAIAIKNA